MILLKVLRALMMLDTFFTVYTHIYQGMTNKDIWTILKKCKNIVLSFQNSKILSRKKQPSGQRTEEP